MIKGKTRTLQHMAESGRGMMQTIQWLLKLLELKNNRRASDLQAAREGAYGGGWQRNRSSEPNELLGYSSTCGIRPGRVCRSYLAIELLGFGGLFVAGLQVK
ncbi:hypothetical protein PIB30_090377 [Stylosanthes scabra]|uniref:Uncharacterized protein n=1 Tax=Stylosanthes scabra TaxID=79078 RepID=A0ABU6ZT64_9FABA|nr:hypothetical protein [Stylosanthes scabra]